MGPMQAPARNRQRPAADAPVVLVRFVIAQVTLRSGEQGEEKKQPAEGREPGDARPGKSSILAMPEESLFDAERLNKELQAAPMDLRGSSQTIGARLSRLMKDRAVEVVNRAQLTTLDAQPAFVQVGQREPRITGAQMAPSGRVNSITFENVGMTAAFTPWVQDNGRVSLEVEMEKSQMAPLEDGAVVSELSGGEKVRSPALENMMVKTTISAAPGQAVALAGVSSRGDSRRTEMLILVSVDVIDKGE